MTDEDPSERYDVLLTGELLPGRRLDEVVRAVSEFYRADESQIARLFAAAPRICRRNLSLTRAKRHLKALRRAGAVVELVERPMDDPRPVARPVLADGAPTAQPARSASATVPASASMPAPPAHPALPGRTVTADAPMHGNPWPAATPVAGDSAALAASGSGEAPPEAPQPPELSAPAGRASGGRPCPTGRAALLGLGVGAVLGALATWWAVPPARHGSGTESGGERAQALASMAQPAVSTAGAAGSDAFAVPVADSPAPAPESVAAAVAATGDERRGDRGGQDAAGNEGGRAQPVTAGDAEPAAVAEPPTAEPADGPFGLSAGMQLRELDVVDEATGPGRKVLGIVPRPMPDIEHVVATVAPDTGLCGLEGRSRALPTTPDGADLRDAFADMEAALDRRWGAQHRTNIRFSRAAPDAQQTWMQSLLAGQRTLASAWIGAAGAPLAPDLERVTLTAVADAGDRGSLRIEYRFPNHADCMAELSADSAPDTTED